MRVESIEIGHAEDGFRAHQHENTSTQHLVDGSFLDDNTFSDSETDLGSIVWRPGVREWLVLSCVSLVAMMDAFAATMVTPIIPVLSAVFQQPFRSVLWVDTSYLLANAASQPLFAMLSEVFGQGPILIIAVVIATAGTGVCTGSLSVPSLVVGRTIQGAGGGGATAVSLLLVTDLLPYPYRARFSEHTCRAWALGAMLGPLSGGVFAQYGNWNWAFYFSYLFSGLTLLVAPFAIDLRECNKVFTHAARKMDWIGAVLTFLGIGSVLMGVSWVGQRPSGWDDWRILVSICIGGLAMVVLVLWESIWVVQPMFNLGIFNSISTIMLYAGCLFQGFLILCHFQNLSMYIFLVKRFSSSLTGVSIMAVTAAALLILLLVNKMRIGGYPFRSRWVIRVGWLLSLLVTGSFILLGRNTPTPGWVLFFFATGLSHALLVFGYNSCSHSESLVCKREEQEELQQTQAGRNSSRAFAILMFSVLRMWGSCIAVPVGGTIVLTQMAQEIDRNTTGSSSSFVGQNGIMLSPDNRDELGHLFLSGFRMAWRFFLGVPVLGGLTSLLIR
ncbi:major facilitator superfamily domain-containing protein [Aspergillus lucknowensis]|uniref:Major facilitator superfamily domain-containing protein n=1 Tax=Aspergillus lucknowensis TaxID=176173 RepID=A0ABR4LMG2_9EURO